jgi:carbonic anhydrase
LHSEGVRTDVQKQFIVIVSCTDTRMKHALALDDGMMNGILYKLALSLPAIC